MDKEKKNKNTFMQAVFLVLLGVDAIVNYFYAHGRISRLPFTIAFIAVLMLSVFGSVSGTLRMRKASQSDNNPASVSKPTMYIVLLVVGVWVYTLVIAVNGIPA